MSMLSTIDLVESISTAMLVKLSVIFMTAILILVILSIPEDEVSEKPVQASSPADAPPKPVTEANARQSATQINGLRKRL